MVAQDTGGAIRGPVRGDVFWGAGPEAEHLAGHMKSPGPAVHPAAARSVADQLSRPKALDGRSLAAIRMLYYNVASARLPPEGPTCCSPAPPRAC